MPLMTVLNIDVGDDDDNEDNLTSSVVSPEVWPDVDYSAVLHHHFMAIDVLAANVGHHEGGAITWSVDT